ncbi:CYCB1-5, partial [Symbiodinium sp. KB8]
AKYEVDPEYFTGVQSEVTPSMRAVLADWMHSLHVSWGLRPETLYGALQLVDRYLTHHAVSRSRLQLVAIAALMASCKLEEQHPPSLADFAASTRDTYSVSEVRRAEMRLCTRLGWKLRGVSPRTFLARFLDAGGARCGDAQANLTKLYCELALVEARFLRYKPSQICAAAVYAGRWQIGLKQGGQFWNPTLERFTGYSRDEVHPIAKELLWAHRDARNSRLRSVVIKYSDKAYGQVSTTFVPLAASGTDSAGNSYPTEFPADEPTHSCCQQGRSKHR